MSITNPIPGVVAEEILARLDRIEAKIDELLLRSRRLAPQARRESWRVTSRKRDVILGVLGDEELTVRSIAARLNDRHPEFHFVPEGSVRTEVRRLLEAGVLDRRRADRGNTVRWVYFAWRELGGEIIELNRRIRND